MDNILFTNIIIFLCCSDSFIFQSLEDKRAKADMISSTIELMVKKEDFSKLEDVCTLTSKSVPGFHSRLRDSLESVPLNVKENLNLDPEVKTKLFEEIAEKPNKKVTLYEHFDTKLAEENLEEVSNILLKVHISDLIHILKWLTFYSQILGFFVL